MVAEVYRNKKIKKSALEEHVKRLTMHDLEVQKEVLDSIDELTVLPGGFIDIYDFIQLLHPNYVPPVPLIEIEAGHVAGDTTWL